MTLIFFGQLCLEIRDFFYILAGYSVDRALRTSHHHRIFPAPDINSSIPHFFSLDPCFLIIRINPDVNISPLAFSTPFSDITIVIGPKEWDPSP